MTLQRLIALLLALAILGVTLFWLCFDSVSENAWGSVSAKVWREPFLAARRLAEKFHVESSDFHSIRELANAGPDAIAVIGNRRDEMTAAEIDELARFVARGGHLWVQAEPEYSVHADGSADDALLERFDVERGEPLPDLDIPWDFGSERIGNHGPTESYSRPSTRLVLTHAGDEADLLVYFERNRGLVMTDDTEVLLYAGTEDNARLLHFGYGEGKVSVMTGFDFAENYQLGRNDNAELFHRLLTATAATRLLFYRAEHVGLEEWLWEHARPVLLTLAALILIYLWMRMPRLGPIAPDPQPLRRRLSDHLLASGRFLWGSGQRGNLAPAACRAALDAVARQYPQFRLFGRDEQVRFLVARLHVAPEMAVQILALHPANQPQTLVALLAACAAIHARLSAHRSVSAAAAAPTTGTPP